MSFIFERVPSLLITFDYFSLLTVTLIINPLNQEIEEAFNIPHGISSVLASLLAPFYLIVSEYVQKSYENFPHTQEKKAEELGEWIKNNVDVFMHFFPSSQEKFVQIFTQTKNK